MIWFGMPSMINCSKLCALTLVLFSMAVAYRDPNDYLYPNNFESHKIATRTSKHYCGKALVKVMAFICDNTYKRSSFAPKESDRTDEFSDQENSMISSDDGLESRSPNYSFSSMKLFDDKNDLKHFHRNVRGIVDQCCRRPCSVSHLRLYCGSSASTTASSVD